MAGNDVPHDLTAAAVLAGLYTFVQTLGPPRVRIWFDGTPVPRPEGKPYGMTRKSREDLREQGGKALAVIHRADAWKRLEAWRNLVQVTCMQRAPRVCLDGPLFGVVEFLFLPGKNDPATCPLVTRKPDAKNLLWAFEDALNPRRRKIPGTKTTMVTWPGLWQDDSLVTLFPVRLYADRNGAQLRLWKVGG